MKHISDVLKLPFLPIPLRNKLPDVRAIYFVVSHEQSIEYIGAAENLRTRWVSHGVGLELDRPRECRVHWLVISEEDRKNMLEAKLIIRFNPRINRKVSTPEALQQKIYVARLFRAWRISKGISTSQAADMFRYDERRLTKCERAETHFPPRILKAAGLDVRDPDHMPIPKLVELAVECLVEKSNDRKVDE